MEAIAVDSTCIPRKQTLKWSFRACLPTSQVFKKDLITDGRWRTDSPLLSAVVKQILTFSKVMNYEKGLTYITKYFG